MKTYTNPDNPSQTYTTGKRGRRPLWVLPLLERDGVTVKDSSKPDSGIKRVAKSTVQGGAPRVFVNPTNPAQSWTEGQRGRRPSWLSLIPDAPVPGAGTYGTFKVETPEGEIERVVSEDQDPQTGLFAWFLRSGNTGEALCMVVAPNPIHATRLFNKTTRSPIGMRELMVVWKRAKPPKREDGTSYLEGVWEKNEGIWKERERITKSDMEKLDETLLVD